jgi:hypothetical protein
MKSVLTLSFSLLACATAALQQPEPKQPDPKQPAHQPSGKLPSGHPGLSPGDPVADWPKPRAEDVASVDAILAAFYKIPAGNKGEPRDWDRYRSLFSPDARLIPARGTPEGGAMAMFVTISDYIALNKNYFEKGGFMDKEVARRTESFGNIAQVWSTFESRHNEADPQPYIRGINSIQLLKDGDRWWIVNVFWELEGPELSVPDQYLKSPEK